MQSLLDTITQTISLNDAEKELVTASFKPVTLTSGTYWIREGQYCNHVAFVQSGRLRIFYVNDNAEEVTCFFMSEPGFISSFTSFLTRMPTTENIVALEDTELLVVDRDELEALSERIPRVQIFRRIVAENLVITLEQRIASLQSQKAGERYEKLMQDNPEILLHVPLQYTASYLGITPQHLSRLRKNKLE